MTDSPTGIFPEDLLFRSRRMQAKAWLIAQPLDSNTKRDLWFAWVRAVGLKAGKNEVAQIMGSGIQEGK